MTTSLFISTDLPYQVGSVIDMVRSENTARDEPIKATDLEELEIAPPLYTDTAQFKARERKAVRKLDIFIAPMIGAFNFIVSR